MSAAEHRAEALALLRPSPADDLLLPGLTDRSLAALVHAVLALSADTVSDESANPSPAGNPDPSPSVDSGPTYAGTTDAPPPVLDARTGVRALAVQGWTAAVQGWRIRQGLERLGPRHVCNRYADVHGPFDAAPAWLRDAVVRELPPADHALAPPPGPVPRAAGFDYTDPDHVSFPGTEPAGTTVEWGIRRDDGTVAVRSEEVATRECGRTGLPLVARTVRRSAWQEQ